ncbi:MAG: precorrin-6y C5,15-methyltransferase (decarboxylating) subunit CbiE [Paracoccaceae bacterium]|nr:MAG: precorrin-6y C5,15-methyltransferase (decarboxylating) subunit CbiE [Paracoccaceae bacterium]
MVDPWLTLIGLGEDGLAGLSGAARTALDTAAHVFGGPRHLALAAVGPDRSRAWPVPFDTAPLLALRGQRVVALVSGDPFWHGAGGSITPHLAAGEWISHPAPSTFQLAANRLGWRLDDVLCLGLHAAPFARLRPVFGRNQPAICLLRDGAAPGLLAGWLCDNGYADTRMTVMEALGGPRERIRTARAQGFDMSGIAAPVAVALQSDMPGLPRSPGLPETAFAHDGQITKAPIRALTIAALAPRRGDLLWDVGAGSGSISVEFALAGGRAVSVEMRADRAANVRANAEAFGLSHRISVIEARAADAIADLPPPDAVFLGGGCDSALLAILWPAIPSGTRVVANAVTVETEAVLAQAQADLGGTLWRFDVAQAEPLGRMRGWAAQRPVVQWRAIR